MTDQPKSADDLWFEEWFGTEEEHQAELERIRAQDARFEAECLAGTRARCPCGAPSLFVHETHGPLCAACGYDRAN